MTPSPWTTPKTTQMDYPTTGNTMLSGNLTWLLIAFDHLTWHISLKNFNKKSLKTVFQGDKLYVFCSLSCIGVGILKLNVSTSICLKRNAY